IIHRFQREPDPFEWSAADAGDSHFEQALFGEADDFGISFGLTIPLRHWHGRYAAVTFASDMRSARARESIRKNSLGLEAVALDFDLRACATFPPVNSVTLQASRRAKPNV